MAKGKNSIKFYTTGFLLPLCNPKLSGGPTGNSFTITTVTLVGAATKDEHILVCFEYAQKKQKTTLNPKSDDLTITIDSGDSLGVTTKYGKVAYPPIDDPKR